jgi:hypothetical protein
LKRKRELKKQSKKQNYLYLLGGVGDVKSKTHVQRSSNLKRIDLEFYRKCFLHVFLRSSGFRTTSDLRETFHDLNGPLSSTADAPSSSLIGKPCMFCMDSELMLWWKWANRFWRYICGMWLCSSARWSAALASSRVCGWSRCCWLRRCPSLHSRLVREERLGLESRVLSKKRDASIIVWEKTGTPYTNKACPPGLFWARWPNPSYS